MNESRPNYSQNRRTSCWKRRTKFEKCLVIITVLLTIFVILLLSIKLRPDIRPKICLTPGCAQSAATLLKNIDETVDPCDDFYKFTCGNYIKTTFLTDYQSSISAFSITSDLVADQIHQLLEEPSTATDLRPFALIKSMYQACMNTTHINRHSVTELRRLIAKTGSWPVLEGVAWNETDFNWETTIINFIKVGFNEDVFYEFAIMPDVKNSSRNVITVNQPYLEHRSEYINGFNESIVQAHYNYLVNLVVALGADRSRAEIEIREIIDLDITIAKILIPDEEQRDSTAMYNPMTIEEIQRKYTYVSWLELINVMLHPVKYMRSDDTIIVATPRYFQQVGSIIEQIPKRTLSNYIYSKAVKKLVRYLSDDLRKIRQDYLNIISGTTKTEPRQKECTTFALRLDIAASALYVRNFFPKETKIPMIEIISNIRKEFRQTLNQIDWMDDVTRSAALEKGDAMAVHIAYPDELFDNAKIENYYKNFSVESTNYLESSMNIALFEKKVVLTQLDKVVDRNDWRRHADATQVNAFYDQNENSIQFPAGILQGQFFSSNRPQYLNYGAIGYLVGHEISHAFDDEGKQFDKDGNLMDWWQPETQEAFDKKAQCIIEQYGNITVPDVGIKINGINCQGENIADNGGIKHAYKAYNRWAEAYGPEPGLPGLLAYSPQQLFWISAGNTWCSINRKEDVKRDLLSSHHSPDYYRVIVPLLNIDDFSKDFNCPKGSKMNPDKKCSIW